jgi:hypothetical protein
VVLAVAVFWVFLSAGQYARAEVYAVTITATPPPDDVSSAYNGQWVFDVSLNAAKDMLLLRVVSGNNAAKTATYKDVTYSFPASVAEGTDYIFSGTSLSNPARGHYNLGASGFFDPVAHTFSLNNPITSQLVKADGTLTGPVYNFNFSNIRPVPEPSSLVTALIALGIFGAGVTLKRRLKPDGARAA